MTGVRITVKSTHNLDTLAERLTRKSRKEFKTLAHRIGSQGVTALQAATPKRTGYTASQWRYEVTNGPNRFSIAWVNDSVTRDGDPIVILLEYGHATGTGGYVRGREFMQPALMPTFDAFLADIRKEVDK